MWILAVCSYSDMFVLNVLAVYPPYTKVFLCDSKWGFHDTVTGTALKT